MYRRATSPARCVVCCAPAGAVCGGCEAHLCARHHVLSAAVCAACAVPCTRCGARASDPGSDRRDILCDACVREWKQTYWVAGDFIAFALILLSPISILLWWIAISGEAAFAIGVLGIGGVWLLGNRALERRRFLAEGRERDLLAERSAQADAAE